MGRRKGPARVRLGTTVLEGTRARLDAEAHRRGVPIGVVIEELALALPEPSPREHRVRVVPSRRRAPTP